MNLKQHFSAFFLLVVLCEFSAGHLCAQKLSAGNLIDSLHQKSDQYFTEGRMDSALVVTDFLYALYAEKGDAQQMVKTKANRAEILRSVVSLDLAYEDLMTVKSLAELLDSSFIKSLYYNRLAAIEFERKNYEETIIAATLAQEFIAKGKDEWLNYSNLNILGAVYRDLKKWDQAIEVLRKTYQLSKDVDNNSEMYLALKNLGFTYFRMGDFRNAVETFKMYQGNKSVGLNRLNISENYRYLARSYKHLGIMDSAFIFLDSAHKHTLDGMQEMVDNRIDDFRIANELDSQKLENSVLVAESDQAKLRFIILITVLLLIVVLAYVFFRQKQSYKKLNAKQQELNEELEASLIFKNKLIAIVAHDIRYPMSSLTGVLHLYNQGMISRDDLKDMMSKLEASAVSVNFLIENLLNWVLNQKEGLEPKIVSLNLNNLLKKVLLELETQSEVKDLSIKIRGLSDQITVQADESMLNLVIRNICSNGIKFSRKGSEIIITYQARKDQHLIMIRDFGAGMSKEVIERLLGLEKNESIVGTGNEKGTGLGIALSIDFLKAMRGSLEIKSQVEQGSEVIIKLPK
jgi:two-component system sensor histidine kinase/response regulator